MPHTFTHDHVGITLTPDDLDATVDWYASKPDFTLAHRYDTHGATLRRADGRTSATWRIGQRSRRSER
jgi:hypothetical protein